MKIIDFIFAIISILVVSAVMWAWLPFMVEQGKYCGYANETEWEAHNKSCVAV